MKDSVARDFPDMALAAQAEAADQRQIALMVAAVEVVQQPAALTDEADQPAARAVILDVFLQVLRQVFNALREKSNLHLHRTGIVFVTTKLLLNFRFVLHNPFKPEAGLSFVFPFLISERL